MSIIAYIFTTMLLGYIFGKASIDELIIIVFSTMILFIFDSKLTKSTKYGFLHRLTFLLLIILFSFWIPDLTYITLSASALIMSDFFGKKTIQLMYILNKRLSLPFLEKEKTSDYAYMVITLILLLGCGMTVDTLLDMIYLVIYIILSFLFTIQEIFMRFL